MLPFLDFFALHADWYGVQTAHLVSGHPAPSIRQSVWQSMHDRQYLRDHRRRVAKLLTRTSRPWVISDRRVEPRSEVVTPSVSDLDYWIYC